MTTTVAQRIYNAVYKANGSTINDGDSVLEAIEREIGAVYAGTPVIQPWVTRLTLMQQSVLISAVRGCDGIPKRHKAKVIVKYYRRCVLYSAFDQDALTDPFRPGGGSFTGPIAELPRTYVFPRGSGDVEMVAGGDTTLYDWKCSILQKVADDLLDSRDELHSHYYDHLMHAFEIVGYKHPEEHVRDYFIDVYLRMARAHHLWEETEEQMDRRLGDDPAQWMERNDRSTSCSD